MKKLIILLILINLFSCTTLITELIESDVQYYSYNGINIRYTDSGSQDSEPLIFIHGFGGNSFTWRYLLKYFSLEYRVISIDLMGFGGSDKPRSSTYLVSEHARIVASFIKDMDLNKVTLVGSSLGGTISLFTYFNAKERVANLILLNPAVYTTEKLPGYIGILQTPLLNRVALKLGPKNLLANIALKTIFYDDSLITPQMIDNYGDNLNNSGTQNALIRSVKKEAFTEVEEMINKYSTVDIPVLIIWGDKDHIVNVKDAFKLEKDLPNSELVIFKNCGHIPQEELPNETIDAIDKFFDHI